MSESPDYTQADMDNRIKALLVPYHAVIKAMVLRLQAKAMREHANSLERSVASMLSKSLRSRYAFASQRAHEEADSLEEQAKELESGA